MEPSTTRTCTDGGRHHHNIDDEFEFEFDSSRLVAGHQQTPASSQRYPRTSFAAHRQQASSQTIDDGFRGVDIDADIIDQYSSPIRRNLTPPALLQSAAMTNHDHSAILDHSSSKLPYVDMTSESQKHFRLLSPGSMDYSNGGSDSGVSIGGGVGGQSEMVDIEAIIRGSSPSGPKQSPAPIVHRRKTFVAILILSCAWMMNDLVLAWVHERVPYQSDPLPDIWFSVFPEYQSAIKLTEALLITCLLCAVAIMIFHRQRWLVTRRVFFISALCYFGRAFCITLTQVPVPSRRTYCAPRANETNAALIFRRMGTTLTSFGMDTLVMPRELCGDLIYSGHTTILCLCYLTVARYAPRRIRWLGSVCQAMALVGVACILIARKHYTLDVVLAYFVTTRIYWMYHTLADNKSTFFVPGKRLGFRGDVANVFWARILRFMESDAPQHTLPIVNQFDLPFRSTCDVVGRMAKKLAAKAKVPPRFPLAVFSSSYWLRWTASQSKANGCDDHTKGGRMGKSAVFLSV